MLILAVALLAVAQDARAAGVQPAPRATEQCTLVELEAVLSATARADAPAGVKDDEFPANGTVDLEFRTTLTAATAGRRVQFRLYTPRGHLYQELPAQAATDSKRAFEARLPVAGTDVVTHSLYGTWTVSAHVDGAPQPCSQVRAFTLKR